MRKILLAMALVLMAGALLVSGCNSSAENGKNYDYVPASGQNCSIEGVHQDAPNANAVADNSRLSINVEDF